MTFNDAVYFLCIRRLYNNDSCSFVIHSIFLTSITIIVLRNLMNNIHCIHNLCAHLILVEIIELQNTYILFVFVPQRMLFTKTSPSLSFV